MSDSAHNVYWKNTIQITPVYTLSGYSRAKEATGFYCRELEMAFDAGIMCNEIPAFICLTHLHNDHCAALNKFLIENPKNPVIFIPDNDKFQELMEAMLKTIYLASKFIHPLSDKGKKPETKYPYQIVKLKIGQSYKFKENNTGSYYVEGLPSDHGVASISFGIYEMRRRCKPEYRDLEKQEYAKMKKDGIDFMEYYKFPILCYMSDTSIEALQKPGFENIFLYPTIVIECTFLEESDISHAKKKKHIHWSQLKTTIGTNNNHFILTHFSKKYTWSQIKNFFDNEFKDKKLAAKITIWLHTNPVTY